MNKMVTQIEQLNAFRASEGKKPITAWKKSRHQPMLDAYVTSIISARTVPNADAMRPLNEELGSDIKATREAWRASGVGITKKEFALDLMAAGATVKTLVDKMGITETAARSLIGDIRRMSDVTVTRVGDVYFAAQDNDEEDAE